MNRLPNTSERFYERVRDALAKAGGEGSAAVTGRAVRTATAIAVSGTRSATRGTGNIARAAVHGAVRATSEMGAETGSFVRDAVIGVVEGAEQIAAVTRPTVREVVEGAIEGAGASGADIGEAGRDVVEGVIVGAASVGIDSVEASTAAVEGVVEAVAEAGADLEEAARATVAGVVSGVSAAGGDLAAATREATHTLMSHPVVSERGVSEAVAVAEVVVEAALEQAQKSPAQTHGLVEAAAAGVVEAAYRHGADRGDRVRRSVLARILEPRLPVAPQVEQRISDIAARLTEEMPRGRATWRGAAMFRAARLVLQSGGIDLSASLAYFTILSLLPLLALVIMIAGLIGDPEAVSRDITEILVYYFPTSGDLIHEALDNLLRGSLAFGVIASVSIVLGANGLFLAANRAVNRIFDAEAGGAIKTTVSQVVITTFVVILFLLTIGLTALFQLVVSLGAGIVESTGGVSTLVAVALGAISTVLPAALTAVLFAVVYYHVPNVRTEWRNAVFGAIVAIILFEIGKHLFFWFTNLATHRSTVYGPVASAVVFMTWAYIAAVIFLYGAALAKVSTDLRPGSARVSGR